MKQETIAIHAGDKNSENDVISPIHLSTTFKREKDGSYPNGNIYSRTSNPNRRALENTMARLEHAQVAAAFSSGSAAAASVFRALGKNDHAIVPTDMYHGIAKAIKNIFIPSAMDISFVDMTNLAELKAAIKSQTKLIWIETPSNPLLKLTDINAVIKIAKSAGAILAVDNTWMPPNMQDVLAMGADIVVHSSTKYLAGHSDVIGGIVVSKYDDEFFKKIRFIQINEGAVPSPFDCWLILRGIKTLAYRMRGHNNNALKIAQYLEQQPQIERVLYPGLASHPQYEIAQKQMTEYGGMLSILLKAGEAAALKLAANLEIFTRATSLGGVESLIEHRASIEGPDSLTPDNLLRISVGLEHIDDLIADLSQALDKL